MSNETELLSTAVALAQAAGRSLLETFGTTHVMGTKGDHSNVVTAADDRSEELIVRGIRKAYPGHSIIAAGLPWFGVLISVLNTALLTKLLRRVRNIRATNSLVDPAYTADGRLGGMLNQSTRIWERALMLTVSHTAATQEYAVLAGAPALHASVAALVRETFAGTERLGANHVT